MKKSTNINRMRKMQTHKHNERTRTKHIVKSANKNDPFQLLVSLSDNLMSMVSSYLGLLLTTSPVLLLRDDTSLLIVAGSEMFW
jgi:hypothetical protein